MPTFDTPGPIDATIEVSTGEVRLNAGDRADTVVEVRPADAHDEEDVEAAEHTQVEYVNGRLLVRSPKRKVRWWVFDWGGSIRVSVDLPAGSRVSVRADDAAVRCEGQLGEARIETASGEVELDRTGKLRVATGDGDVSVGRAVGQVEVDTADGEIRIREIDGTAMLKTSNGPITVGQVTGDARLNTAHGEITVDRALAGVDAKTSSGSVTVGEVRRGSIDLKTSDGTVEVGIPEGTAAWLDVSSGYGMVRSSLPPAGDPSPAEETVEVRARTSSGDIVIRRP